MDAPVLDFVVTTILWFSRFCGVHDFVDSVTIHSQKVVTVNVDCDSQKVVTVNGQCTVLLIMKGYDF
jgi:hypothetical protein